MGDALRALIDAADLRARYGFEVRSDDEHWTLGLGPTTTHTWVASSSRTAVHLLRGRDRSTEQTVEPGTAVLVAPDESVTIRTGPVDSPPPVAEDDWFSATGVHVGSASFGPLAAETLALPASIRTEPLGAPHEGVVQATAQLESLVGGRWRAAQRDALARVIVTEVIADNPPAFLVDNSLTRCIDRLVDRDHPVPIDELRHGTGMSASTVHRRFRSTTGCAPDELRRWYRSLLIRAALVADDRAAAARTAEHFGFSTTSSMRRALGRVRAPETGTPERL